MGGFKDPNVLAPSTLFVLIILNELDFSLNKIITFSVNLAGLILIILAQSRAALLITVLYIFYKIFSKNIKTRVFTILSILIFVLFYTTSFENLYQSKFGDRSDSRRFSGQKEALNISTLFGNGATSSDYLVGHPPHNSIVRIISDNGVFTFSVLLIWFLVLLFNSSFKLDKFYLIFLAILIGFVIDTLHWRILFIYIGSIVFIHNNKINGKLYI